MKKKAKFYYWYQHSSLNVKQNIAAIEKCCLDLNPLSVESADKEYA